MARNREAVDSMNLSISCTTGTRLDLPVPVEETVDGLKRRLSQKLRVPKDRLMLLLRDTRLSSGKLQDFGVGDGSRLTLVPAVEAGLMSQSWRPEQSVLQALESLTDVQVSDFLSGRSPQRDPSSPPCSPVPHTHHNHSVQSPSSATPSLQAEDGVHSPTQPHKPGAFIESLVNHAPGVFSGTFSGTLHSSCQDSCGHPRRDITTILQILNDLLSATRHYRGTPPTLAHLRCRTPFPPTTPCSPSYTSETQQSDLQPQPSGECLRQTENKATRCKVEQLQLLLRQRRLRRRARRDPRGPYRWPADRKATRRHSNSSLSSDSSLDVDMEEAVWKPDVQPDINAEYVVA
ncbi:Midnolin Midbrain nucleolar protein [Triplophysa tibetana]|uniref:Midnolin Midbrain nucleolar protein n=1 Tax=Triplophysa tibetana TaxID=1572043 RepID=A0A5A9PCD4_9TELE|nr:Midnolin Midbrain nucleolar protein [Triplophysa tibetana]